MSRHSDGKVYHVRSRDKNWGLPLWGWEYWHPTECPCSVCGHKTQKECDEAQCNCCSSFCT